MHRLTDRWDSHNLTNFRLDFEVLDRLLDFGISGDIRTAPSFAVNSPDL